MTSLGFRFSSGFLSRSLQVFLVIAPAHCLDEIMFYLKQDFKTKNLYIELFYAPKFIDINIIVMYYTVS